MRAGASDSPPTPTPAQLEALEALYRERFTATSRLAYLLTGDRDAADELAQEAFVRLHRHMATVDNRRRSTSPHGWWRSTASGRESPTTSAATGSTSKSLMEGSSAWPMWGDTPLRQTASLADDDPAATWRPRRSWSPPTGPGARRQSRRRRTAYSRCVRAHHRAEHRNPGPHPGSRWATCEETIVAALDVLDADRFWAQADAAASWRESLTPEQRQKLLDAEAAVDRTFDGIE